MTRILAISNRKGGTGKTATTVNLSAAAAAAGLRVLVVDLDTQGHAGIGLGVEPRRGEPTVHALFREPGFDLSTALRPTVVENVSILPADQQFDGAATDRSPTLLRRQLRSDALSRDFDLVVIDTPPAYDVLLVNALAAAHGVVVPTLPHALALEGVRQLARIVFHVAARIDPQLRLTGILPVMVGGNPRHHRSVLEALAREFGASRILDGIRTDIRVAEAFGERLPVMRHAPDARAAADYQRLLSQLREREAIGLSGNELESIDRL